MAANQYQQMTQTPAHQLVLKLCIPTIVSMLITNVYNLVDTYFVSQLGTSASGAIGIVFSLMAVIQALGFMMGHGSSTNVSRMLGKKNIDAASCFASTGFFLALAGGTVLGVAGLVFLQPFMRLLGSTDTILPYTCAYAMYILAAAPVMAASCVLNNLLRYEGRAALGMIGLGVGAVLNMIGDPIFVFGFGMGIHGAGLSTALSQYISFLILLSMFLTKRTQCRLSVRCITWDKKKMTLILKNGMPSLARQGLTSLSAIVLNQSAAFYGDIAVAAISIVGRICNFISALMVGIGQGMQPVVAFSYGAGKYSRVKEAFCFTALLGQCTLSCLAVGCFLCTRPILNHFSDDPRVVEIAVQMLRFQSLSLVFQPLSTCSNQAFQSIGISGRATLLSSLRSGILLIPILRISTRFWGLLGIQTAQAVTDILVFFIALPMIIRFFMGLPEDRASFLRSI